MKKYSTVDEYIENFPKDTQDILKKFRKLIKKAAPRAVESISYGIPAFKMNGRPLIYFAGYANHVSFYPIPPGPSAFTKKIKPYIKGKGTLQFQLKDPICYDLAEEIVKYSIEKNIEIYGKKK